MKYFYLLAILILIGCGESEEKLSLKTIGKSYISPFPRHFRFGHSNQIFRKNGELFLLEKLGNRIVSYNLFSDEQEEFSIEEIESVNSVIYSNGTYYLFSNKEVFYVDDKGVIQEYFKLPANLEFKFSETNKIKISENYIVGQITYNDIDYLSEDDYLNQLVSKKQLIVLDRKNKSYQLIVDYPKDVVYNNPHRKYNGLEHYINYDILDDELIVCFPFRSTVYKYSLVVGELTDSLSFELPISQELFRNQYKLKDRLNSNFVSEISYLNKIVFSNSDKVYLILLKGITGEEHYKSQLDKKWYLLSLNLKSKSSSSLYVDEYYSQKLNFLKDTLLLYKRTQDEKNKIDVFISAN